MNTINKKIFEMSHNVCYRRDNLRYRLGDIVTWLDDIYVVVCVVLDSKKNRYVLRDSDGATIIVYEEEILPYIRVGAIVDVGMIDGNDSPSYCVVRKVKGYRLFVYNENFKFGFWIGFDEVNKVIKWKV